MLVDRLLSALLALCVAWWVGRLFSASARSRSGSPTPAPRPKAVPALSADALRADDAPPWHREMRCDEAIPPVSVATSRDVEVFCESFFIERHDRRWPRGEGASDGGDDDVRSPPQWVWDWAYRVQFRNRGTEAVQLLTRHWVFVDANGAAHEVMGPGARGKTPVIVPGGEWTYESGTSLRTAHGSMRGSFGLVALRPAAGGDDDALGAPFAVRVARLALSSSGKPVRVPCGPPLAHGRVPPSSVAISRRVIVGTTSAARPRSPIDGSRPYSLDVQVNNARHAPILLVGREWHISGAGGLSRVVDAGARGALRHDRPPLARATRVVHPGSALRFGTVLTVAPELSDRAIAAGHLLVCLLDDEREGGDDDAIDAACEPVRVEIGRVALSSDGLAVDANAALDNGSGDDTLAHNASSESHGAG